MSKGVKYPAAIYLRCLVNQEDLLDRDFKATPASVWHSAGIPKDICSFIDGKGMARLGLQSGVSDKNSGGSSGAVERTQNTVYPSKPVIVRPLSVRMAALTASLDVKSNHSNNGDYGLQRTSLSIK